MKLKLAALGSALLLACAATAPVMANTITWNFYTLGGSPAAPGTSMNSTSATFQQGGIFLQVVSATSSGCTQPYSSWCPGTGDLYVKNGGTGEQGLGLTNDPYKNNEIANPNGIYLSPNQGFISSIQLGSVQAGETWSIWGSNDGLDWSELGWGTGTGNGATVNYNSPTLLNYDQIIVADPYLMNQGMGSSNNVVLACITTVPEPGTLALFAAGLLGCALVVARRRARQN